MTARLAELMTAPIGVGACLARHGKAEMKAGIEAAVAISRARYPKEPTP